MPRKTVIIRPWLQPLPGAIAPCRWLHRAGTGHTRRLVHPTATSRRRSAPFAAGRIPWRRPSRWPPARDEPVPYIRRLRPPNVRPTSLRCRRSSPSPVSRRLNIKNRQYIIFSADFDVLFAFIILSYFSFVHWNLPSWLSATLIAIKAQISII